MREAHVEVGGIGVFRRDRSCELVLLVLQDVGKPEFILHLTEVELGDHRMRNAVVEAVRT